MPPPYHLISRIPPFIYPIPSRTSLLLTGCTTSRLSYMPNCGECLLPNKSYAPIRKYEPSGLPMDLDTTMQLSYQPACEPIAKVEKPWAKQPDYHKPTTKIEDSTTYELRYVCENYLFFLLGGLGWLWWFLCSFMAPGMLVPCGPEVLPDPVTNSCPSEYINGCSLESWETMWQWVNHLQRPGIVKLLYKMKGRVYVSMMIYHVVDNLVIRCTKIMFLFKLQRADDIVWLSMRF